MNRIVELSQVEYYCKIDPIHKSEVISKNTFPLKPRVLQRKLRAFTGACLRITQTRYDISYNVGLLSSLLPDALQSVDSLKLFCAISSKTYSRIVNQHVTLRYAPFPETSNYRRFRQIFSFSDASMATGPNPSSVEACVIVFGVPSHRDGLATCYGHMLSWRSRKIIRVCRSSAQSEEIALPNACELTLFMQIAMTEVPIGNIKCHFCTALNPNRFRLNLKYRRLRLNCNILFSLVACAE